MRSGAVQLIAGVDLAVVMFVLMTIAITGGMLVVVVVVVFVIGVWLVAE